MMSDLSVAVSIARTELGLSTLDLTEASGYSILTGLEPGDLVWELQTVGSPHVHGEYLAGAKKGMMTANLRVLVEGSTGSQMESRIGTLLAALAQFSYHLTVTIAGAASTWNCMPADVRVVGTPETTRALLHQHRRIVTARIPRHLTPVAGSI